MHKKSATPLSLYAVYSGPFIITTWLAAPIGLLQGIYAKYYGLPLTTIAAIILVAKFFNAVTDPLIGYFSDYYYQRFRTRKPFILAGALLCLLSSYFLYVPTDIGTLQALTQVSAAYFTTCFLLFFLAWTLFEIPHIAWASELAPAANDKSKLFSVRTTAYYIGILLFYLIPLLPMFETNDITPETLRISVIVASVLMLFLLCLCLWFTPNTYSHAVSRRQGTAAIKTKRKSAGELRSFLKSLLSNKPYLLFTAAFLLEGVSTGIFYGVFFIYVDAYLNLGHYYAQTAILGLLASIGSIPLWHRLAIQFGKINTWTLSLLLIISGFVLVHSFEPGDTGFYGLVGVMVLLNTGFACMWIMASAMLSEIVDYSTWKYRVEKTATYFSLYAFIGKAGHALASAMGLGIAGWYGLDVTATVHDADSVWGLRLVMTWIPLGFAVLAVVFIALSPIDVHRHGIVRRRLDNKALVNSF